MSESTWENGRHTVCPFLFKVEINRSWWRQGSTLNWAETSAQRKQPHFPHSAYPGSGSTTACITSPRPRAAYTVMEETTDIKKGHK